MSIFYTVNCDPARDRVDAPDLTYVGPPAGWAALMPYKDRDLELQIDGDEDAPYPRNLALAELALGKLDALEAASDGYLRAFVIMDPDIMYGPWRVCALKVNWSPAFYRSGEDFELRLSIGEDHYGEWIVRFKHHTFPRECLAPYYFSRRQC